MQTFTDNAGRTWTVAVNVNAIKRVRGLLGVDLLEIVEGKLIEKLYCDPVLLCDVIYALCKPEADAKGVTDEAFGQAMAGDAIERATKALLDELVGFSPNPLDRANLQRATEMTQRAMDAARRIVAEKLDAVDEAALVKQALAESGSLSGSAPASSGSTPAS